MTGRPDGDRRGRIRRMAACLFVALCPACAPAPLAPDPEPRTSPSTVSPMVRVDEEEPTRRRSTSPPMSASDPSPASARSETTNTAPGDPTAAAADRTLHVLLFQPLAPGSPQEARPLMEDVARYFADRAGFTASTGRYENDRMSLSVEGAPSWNFGLVSLEYALEHGDEWELLASSVVQGEVTTPYRLLTALGTPDWRPSAPGALILTGPALGEEALVRRVVFENALPEKSAMRFHPSALLLKALRHASQRLDQGVLARAHEFAQYQAGPVAPALQVAWTSAPVPNAPLVASRSRLSDEQRARLGEIALAMGHEAEGRALIERLAPLEGFGAVDQAAMKRAAALFDAGGGKGSD